MNCDFCHLPLPPNRRSDEGPDYCCFGCKLAADITRSRGEAGQANWMLTRLGLSVFLSMIVMMFSMYLYRQHFVEESETTVVSTQLSGVMRYLCLIFSAPVFLMLGLPVLEAAGDEWRRRRISTDAFVVLGVAAALILSYTSTLRDRGPVYYETACIVLVFLTLGRWLEANGKLKASAAVRGLETLIPDEVSVERSGASLAVRPEDVLVGDLLVIPAGQRIAADARVETGRANVDESILTGEPSPIAKEPGDLVRAGTLNLDGMLRVRAISIGAESTLGRLVALLEEAKRSRSDWERLTDRISRVFVPVMLALAIIGFSLGMARGGLDQAVLTALSVVLISCPCALGIATPMVVWVALGSAARHGVLFRNGSCLESLARVKTVCFDKTGTLTDGAPLLHSLIVAAGTPERETVSLAAGVAMASRHSFGDAIRIWSARQGIDPAQMQEARTIPGRGAVGEFQQMRVVLGSTALMREEGLSFDESLVRQVEITQQAGYSLACIGWQAMVRGVFKISESLRPEAARAVRQLQSHALQVRVLTGDHSARAEMIARELGTTTLGGLTPEQKVGEVQSLRSTGPVAMVGDGLNDAPALAAADVGIAMGCGADLTRENAGVCLLGNDPALVPWAINLARRTVRIIKINLFWAFFYNLIGIALALSGRLNPIFAAGAMIVSSLMVVANSLRLDQALPSLPTNCSPRRSPLLRPQEVAA